MFKPIPLLSKSEITSFYLVSMAVQPGLCRTWSDTQIVDFLTQLTSISKTNGVVFFLSTYVGSLAKFKKRHTFSIEPFSSKSCLKNLAISIFTYKKIHVYSYILLT